MLNSKKEKIKKYFLAVFLSLFYSVVYIVLGPMIAAQDMRLDWSCLRPFTICFILCIAINLFVLWAVPKLCLCLRSRSEGGAISQFFNKIGNRKFFLLVWIFIFVSWIPAYLNLYPGVLSYDIISQEGSALSAISSNHHPILHTWLIRVFMNLGKELFSGYEYGLGLLSLAQMIILSYALARLVLLLKKREVPILLVLLTALLSAGWFMNACLSVTMIKDTLHAAFLVLFVCHFVEILTDPSEYFRKKQNLFLFPIISFLMCAFRNNGIHIYIFCFVGLFLLRLRQIRKAKAHIALIAVILLAPFMYMLYTGPVFTLLGITQTESREALSVPIQQLQRVTMKRGEELTDEQLERMNYYITDLAWMEAPPERYDPFWADFAKSCFISQHYDSDPIAFWKFYLQIGEQFSKEYMVAFLSNTLGFWYPGYYRFSYVMYDNYAPEMFVVPLERKSIWRAQALGTYYKSLCSSDFWRKTPVLRLFFVPGFTFWFLLYGVVLAWKKKGFFTRIFPLFLPLIAQYGIMILSPMSSFRYAWPFYLMLPLVLMAICEKEGTD